MEKLKKIILMLLVFCGLIGSFEPMLVNAKTAPSTITTKSKSKMYYFNDNRDYISGYNFYRKELTDGTLAYCVSNISSDVPSASTMTLKNSLANSDPGLDYIIKNGYPSKSFTGDANKDYYITQAAIWKYFDETKGSTNWRGTTFNSSSTGMKGYVYKLVQEAKVAKNLEVEKPSLNLVYLNKQMKLSSDFKYYISDLIMVSTKNTKDTYKVNLENAPDGTIVKNKNGEIKTEFTKDEGFIVYVPSKTSKGESGSVSLTVSTTGVTYSTYSYQNNKPKEQDIAPVEIYEVLTDLVSEKLVLSYEKDPTKVRISKQDITSKEELPGATLVIKDTKGNEVARWVSTNESHYIEGLEPGDYTLSEIIAPDGYKLSEETIKFTVNANGVQTNVIMYNEKHITKVKISKQDIVSNEEVPGATLVIKDKNGKEIEKWVSTTEPHYIEGLDPGDYTLTEIIAPEGYILSKETVDFTVKADGKTTTAVMYNAKETKVTKVKISKQDITTKEEVKGATLVIKDKDGNVVDTWVSTTEPHYIEGLEPGNYTLTETIQPEGYILSQETVEFTVLDDGSLTSVVMFNEKYTEVPITDLNIDSKVIIIASVLMILGSCLVVYYAKHSK